MRGIVLALLLGGLSLEAGSQERLSGEEVQAVMQQMQPMFTTLTVCVSGECSAAYECGLPPHLVRRPDGSVQVFVDCDEPVQFQCNNGVMLRGPTEWCRVDFSNGKHIIVTMTHDGFVIEGV